MTNFEKYKDEILKLLDKNIDEIGILKTTGEPKNCYCINCTDCWFCNKDCRLGFIKWLYQEYKEKLTKVERGFCEILQKGYIARDKNGNLFVYDGLPRKGEFSWMDSMCRKINNNFFPFISWESDKIWSIEDLLKLEVEE